MLRRGVLLAVAGADAVALVGLRARPTAAIRTLGAPHAAVARAGADGVVATLAGALLWLLAAYTVLALVLAAA